MNQNYRDQEITIPQGEPTPITSSNPLLRNGRYSCFCIPSTWFDRVRQSAADHDRHWLATPFFKVREWSELVAGPKWKTFIRRFNRNHHHHHSHGKFQYDPLSYSLNFDEGGANGNLDNQDEEFRGFSTRFASAAPTPVKPLSG